MKKTGKHEQAGQTEIGSIQNQRNNEPDSGRLGSPQREGESTRLEQDGASNPNGKGRDESLSRGVGFGGILSQLKELQQAHLAYIHAHRKRLETRLQENLEHEQKIAEEAEKLEIEIISLLEKVKREQEGS